MKRLLGPLAALALIFAAQLPIAEVTPLAPVAVVQAAQHAPVAVPSCAGYPEPRAWLEAHDWWTQTGEASPGRHIHVETCFPLHQTIGRSLHLDLTIREHTQPGTINQVRIQAWPSYDPAWSKTVSLACATDNCVFQVPADVPLTGATGTFEFRVTANIASNAFGKRQYQSTRWDACVVTCSGGYSTHRTGAAGWYLDTDYTNVYINDSAADRLAYGGPLTSPLTFTAKGDGKLIASIDANSHAGDPGIILPGNGTYTIDPALLAPGTHKLFLRAEEQGADGVNAGQYVQGFTVGGTPQPTPAPTGTPTPTPTATPEPTQTPEPTGTPTPIPSVCS